MNLHKDIRQNYKFSRKEVLLSRRVNEAHVVAEVSREGVRHCAQESCIRTIVHVCTVVSVEQLVSLFDGVDLDGDYAPK